MLVLCTLGQVGCQVIRFVRAEKDEKWRECAKHGYSCRWNVVHIVYIPPPTCMHVALRRTIKPVAAPAARRSRRGYRSLCACAHAPSISTFIPADPCDPLPCFQIRHEWSRWPSGKNVSTRHSSTFFDAIEICILMSDDELIAGDRYRHKGRRCRL